MKKLLFTLLLSSAAVRCQASAESILDGTAKNLTCTNGVCSLKDIQAKLDQNAATEQANLPQTAAAIVEAPGEVSDILVDDSIDLGNDMIFPGDPDINIDSDMNNLGDQDATALNDDMMLTGENSVGNNDFSGAPIESKEDSVKVGLTAYDAQKLDKNDPMNRKALSALAVLQEEYLETVLNELTKALNGESTIISKQQAERALSEGVTIFWPANTFARGEEYAAERAQALNLGDALLERLLYHIIIGQVAAANVAAGLAEFTTLSGESIIAGFDEEQGRMTYDGQPIDVILADQVVSEDVDGKDRAIVHVLKGSMLTPVALAQPSPRFIPEVAPAVIMVEDTVSPAVKQIGAEESQSPNMPTPAPGNMPMLPVGARYVKAPQGMIDRGVTAAETAVTTTATAVVDNVAGMTRAILGR